MTAVLYSLSLLLSAALLMAIQPLAGRMLLPALGGSPAVWNTCLVFFQVVLLLGYLYSHWLAGRESATRQIAIHAGVLVLAAMTLPIALGNRVPTEDQALIGWLLLALLVGVGPAFFAVSATAPLLQSWFGRSGLRSAKDPYFLYAASNIGSLAMLVAYPLLIEPKLRLAEQASIWRFAFFGLIGFILLCGSLVGRRVEFDAKPSGDKTRIPPSIILRWIALAFIPSSLLQAVTTFITTDVASMPLLWMAPLGVYFATFIWAFSTAVPLPLKFVSSVVAIAVLALFLVMFIEATEPLPLVLGIHLLAFGAIGLLCHGSLAKSRPSPEHLTGFYLWIAVGGALGSAFNALLAPVIFQSFGQVEYPLMLIAACLVRPEPSTLSTSWRDFLYPALLLIAVAALLVGVQYEPLKRWLPAPGGEDASGGLNLRGAILYGLPIIVVFTMVDKPLRFVLALGGLVLLSTFDTSAAGTVLYRSRNFLGVLKVTRDSDNRFVRLVHGRTIHGQEWLDPAKRREPLTYYHPQGPIGHVMRVWHRSPEGPEIHRVGVVGLGIGSLLGYARSSEDWTCFELDPAVIAIAKDERYFHFLADSSAHTVRFHVGDARLRLQTEDDGAFDLLVLDAFSSDAIPMHLLTREAIALDVRKLAPGGLLAFHVSNRHLDLPPVLARIAESFDPPLVARECQDDGEAVLGKFASHWVILARQEADLAELKKSTRWFPLKSKPKTPLWTDDFATIFDILKWKGEE